MSTAARQTIDEDIAASHGDRVDAPELPSIEARAFCTACGADVTADGGGCRRCHPSAHRARPVAVPPSPPRRPRRPIVFLAALAATVGTLAGLSWRTASDLRSDLRETQSELAAERADRDRTDDSQTTELATALDRVATLEARVAGTADPAALAAESEPSVFTVETERGLGSAFVVRSGAGTSSLITNFHVISSVWLEGGDAVLITRGDETYDGTIVDADAASDLAVIEVDAVLPALTIETDEPIVGAPIIVVGSPLGLGGTVTSGIVSAVRTEDGIRRIQISAPISPGNSGGPVLDAGGQVIGVSVSKAVTPGAEGLGFAIPATQVCAVIPVC